MSYSSFSYFVLCVALCCSCTVIDNGKEKRRLDSIAVVERQNELLREKEIEDSVLKEAEAEKLKLASSMESRFRFSYDEFSEKTWVYYKRSPRKANVNAVFIYFCKERGKARNLRFRFQYEASSWLFIKKAIFNIDGENYTYIPCDIDEDCSNGRVWEWCDCKASNCMELVNKIAGAKTVKVKYIGQKYSDVRLLSSSELLAFKETLEFFNLLK